jgi:hypothetical protein
MAAAVIVVTLTGNVVILTLVDRIFADDCDVRGENICSESTTLTTTQACS